jgi:hypothetical protein
MWRLGPQCKGSAMKTNLAKSATAVLLGIAAFSAAFASSALAQPDSTVTGIFTESGPSSTPYTSPAGGYQVADSGELWASCSGLLTTPGNAVHNSASSAWAKKSYEGTITGVDAGAWHLNASCFLDVYAGVTYNPTSPVWVENHRSEATGTVEIRGDFGDLLDETECAVDNYTSIGTTTYNATGCESDVYPNAGEYKVAASDAPNAGTSASTATPGLIINNWLFSETCDFFLYCKAAQYIYSNEEEDAEFLTIVDSSDPAMPGWTGALNSYEVIGGVLFHIRTHPIP